MELLIIILLLGIAAEVSYLVLQTHRKTTGKKGKLIFVDTSVLIDGRIVAVAASGFITDTLAIPRSVIGELQFLADNSDSEKRSRARHGLDVVKELQSMPNLSVEIFQDGSKAAEGVDERLLKLAKQYNGVVCTIDFNLNKVAQVEKIPVLNVNDLAMSLRMAYLPGEKIMLEMTQKGQDGHQAIGHLPDGTMVVVEHAHKNIGQTIEIEFIRSLQTAAGKMMFAKVAGDAAATEKKASTPARKVAEKTKSNGRAPAQKASKVEAAPDPVVEAPAPQARKKPQAPKPEAAKKQPAQRSSVRREHTEPTVYHSDSNDRRIAPGAATSGASGRGTRRQSPRKEAQEPRTADQPTRRSRAPESPAKPLGAQTQPQKPRQARPKTSAQREASLIDLLNNQD